MQLTLRQFLALMRAVKFPLCKLFLLFRSQVVHPSILMDI